MKMAVLEGAAMYTGNVENYLLPLDDLKLYLDWVIFCIVMYYIYGQSGPSLLVESTDSMIHLHVPQQDHAISELKEYATGTSDAH